jgi:hypothetical protein
MLSESTPVLSRAISHFEMFMTEWERLGVQHEILNFWTDIGLDWAKKYYVRMDETDAYVVVMCKFYPWYVTALTADLNPQSSILPYASRGSTRNGKLYMSSARGT